MLAGEKVSPRHSLKQDFETIGWRFRAEQQHRFVPLGTSKEVFTPGMKGGFPGGKGWQFSPIPPSSVQKFPAR
jgi:hypothetical protein